MTELDDDGLEFVDVAEDPSVLAAVNALTEGVKPPELPNPLDGPVTLPGGFRRVKATPEGTVFEDVTKAWVRELTGEDEEKLARARLKDDTTAFVDVLLKAGVVKLGDREPTAEDFNSLLMGDQAYLLLEIARATYGNDVDFENFPCPNCGETIAFTIHLDEDVPVKKLGRISDAEFDIKLRNDRVAHVTLPNVEVASKVAAVDTPAEKNTILIQYCVEEISGPKGTTAINGDRDQALKMGIVDRRKIVTEMSEHMPGPQYNDIRFKHDVPECGGEIRFGITLADLFPEL